MKLRTYQKEAVQAIQKQWEEGYCKTLLVLPTGCGKTIVFAKVTEECVREGKRVLILAHRGELLEQAADKLFETTGIGGINLQLGWYAADQMMVLDGCSNYISEMELYSWKENADNEPEDGHDHMINSVQYAFLPYVTLIGVSK